MDPERLQPQRQPEPRQPQVPRPEIQRPQRPEPPAPQTPEGRKPEPPAPQSPTAAGRPERPPVRDLGAGGGGAAGMGGSGRGASGSPPAGLTGQTGGPPPGTTGGAKPGGGAGNPLIKVLAVAALAIGGWAYFKPAPVYTGPEDAAPHYKDNKNSDPRTPAVFAARDIDRKRTDEARQAAQRGEPIPGINNPSGALIDAIKAGKVTFYAVRVYDTCAEDGDVVSLDLPLGGEVGPIPLTIAGTVISVPVVNGGPASVRLIGVKDGVGGITMGAQTSGGVWYSKVMQPGESEIMPLSIQ